MISTSGLTKYFGDKLILEDVNVSVEQNDRIGLVGKNGAGKSTLLHLLTKKLAPDEGKVDITKDITIGMLEQNSGLNGENNIIEEMRSVFYDLIQTEQKLRKMEKQLANAGDDKKLNEEYSTLSAWFEAKGGYHLDIKIKAVLNGMGFADKDREMKISALSGGEKTRLAIAKLLLEEPNLLILDEPTNHLDFSTLSWLENYLASYRGGLLVVSHDRYFLDHTVSKIWDVDDQHIVTYKGNYTKFKSLKSERTARLLKEYETQQLKISAMEDYVQKNIVRASTSKMAKSRLHQMSHIELLKKPREGTATPKFSFSFSKNPVKDVLSVRNLTVTAGSGEHAVILAKGVTFSIQRGEKVALIGKNGAGKSTLLKALLFDKSPSVVWGDNVQTGYYEQENRTLSMDSTALEEMQNRFPRLKPYEARGILGQVLLTGDNVFKKIGVLSGGERARTALAVLMAQHANVLLLDEPTNHLDLISKEALEEALSAFRGTLLFVSHDRYFLNTIPDKILEFDENGLTLYPGNFDFYLSEKEKEKAAQELQKEAAKKESAGARSYYRSKKDRAEEASKKARIAKLEKAIDESEKTIAQLQNELSQPDNASNYAKLSELCHSLEDTKSLHDGYYAEWAKLSGFES